MINKLQDKIHTHKTQDGDLQISHRDIRRRCRPLLRPGSRTRRRSSFDGLHAKTYAVSKVHTRSESTASSVMLRTNERDRGERLPVPMHSL